ncbi:WD40-repeat-containing domain protein [Radiomyces spectabilis]|uniref:WD40-repeat-containing domain protein n=1 Tax=Radiomyces spectabilis TaxID=64574 RepID=UPI0022211738|nr:WD40-repeat-containing domain protein [Radiomyces spectabilis]KAI8388884.1 WD40-repeat-containing domain protein [Radiomyces spectabilis]
MQDSFFASTRKRKRSNQPSDRTKNTVAGNATTAKPRRAPKKKDESDDEADGPSTLADMNLEASEAESSEEEIEETAAEKRVRLAKAYLDKIQHDMDEDLGGFDAADLDRDLIAERLKKDDDEAAGKIHRRIADKFDFTSIDDTKIRSCRLGRGNNQTVTAVVLADNGQFFYTASKDGSIIKYDTTTLKKLHTFPGGRKGAKDYIGHTQDILALALSSDHQYLASGGRDKLINIWSVKDNTHIATFSLHKDAVSGLAFRKGSNQLYSASHDRTIKLWNVDERAYIETLFGHQDQITAIDTLSRERCMTTGGRDKTARLWKIVEESQLVYRGGVTTKDADGSERILYAEGSLDCVAQIDEDIFVTGGDSGAISLWDINRKKPLFSLSAAHGLNTTHSESEGDIDTPYWITALACIRYSDVFVSGSWDGFVRVWKLAADNKSFQQIAQIPVQGVVNSLQIKTTFPSKRTILVIGVGQELRLGRWLRVKGSKNCAKVVELPIKKSSHPIENVPV